MRRWILVGAVLLLVAVGLGAAFAVADDRDHRETDRVVTTTDGETLVVREDDDGPRFFPFGFILFPLFWFLVIGLLFAAFGRRRWGGPGPWSQGPGPGGGAAPGWFEEWHRRAHEGNAPPPPGAGGPAESGA